MEINKIEFETFNKINSYHINLLKKEFPSIFNGEVSIRRYKVTIEEIEEPIETLQERLQKLYDEGTNYHHIEPLKREAKKLNYTFKPH